MEKLFAIRAFGNLGIKIFRLHFEPSWKLAFSFSFRWIEQHTVGTAVFLAAPWFNQRDGDFSVVREDVRKCFGAKSSHLFHLTCLLIGINACHQVICLFSWEFYPARVRSATRRSSVANTTAPYPSAPWHSEFLSVFPMPSISCFAERLG